MIVKRENNIPFFSNLFDSRFDEFISNERTAPAVNIIEQEKKYELKFAVPGMKKSDFKIELKDEILTISTSIDEDKNGENVNFTKREYNFNSFSKAFRVDSKTMNLDQLTARYENGELILDIPKLESAIPTNREIEIN